MSLFNFKKKSITNQEEQDPEAEKLKTQINIETEYLKKLIHKFYENPGNNWKQRLRFPQIYMGGKVERVKEDHDYHTRRNDKRHFILDPEIREMNETERRIRVLHTRLRALRTGKFNLFEYDQEEYEDEC